MVGSAEADREERNLPPIHRIKEPRMQHMSTRIRWFYGMGYKIGEIHKHLGVRYQQVRNVVTTEPKRAMREDVPAFVLEVLDLDTDLELMEQQALVDQMAAQRAEDRAERKRVNRRRREAREAGEDREDREDQD